MKVEEDAEIVTLAKVIKEDEEEDENNDDSSVKMGIFN